MMIFVPVIILLVVGLILLLRPWPFYLAPKQPHQYPERNVAVEFTKWVELRARARGLNVRGVARTVLVECPKCRKASNYFVYPDEVCERCWRASLKPVSTPAKEHRS
jgi:hypothetical protein